MTATMYVTLFSMILLFALVCGDDECIRSDYLEVSGTGKGSYLSTLALVELGILTRGRKVHDVQNRLSKASERLSNYLHAQSVIQLWKRSVSTNSMKSNRKRPPFLTWHGGAISVRFEASIKNLGHVLGGSMHNGASIIISIKFKGNPEDEKAVRAEAIRNVIINARASATAATAVTEKELLSPISIAISNVFLRGLGICSNFAKRDEDSSARR